MGIISQIKDEDTYFAESTTLKAYKELFKTKRHGKNGVPTDDSGSNHLHDCLSVLPMFR